MSQSEPRVSVGALGGFSFSVVPAAASYGCSIKVTFESQTTFTLASSFSISSPERVSVLGTPVPFAQFFGISADSFKPSMTMG